MNYKRAIWFCHSSSHSSSSYVIPNYYRGFLKAFPTSRTIDTEELHDFARQIARGMEHLELKGITHRYIIFDIKWKIGIEFGVK